MRKIDCVCRGREGGGETENAGPCSDSSDEAIRREEWKNGMNASVKKEEKGMRRKGHLFSSIQFMRLLFWREHASICPNSDGSTQ